MYKDDLIDVAYDFNTDSSKEPEMPLTVSTIKSDPLEEQLKLIGAFYNVSSIDGLTEEERHELFYDALSDRSVAIDDYDLVFEYGVDLKSLLRDLKRGIIDHTGLGKILEERVDEALTQMISPMLDERLSCNNFEEDHYTNQDLYDNYRYGDEKMLDDRDRARDINTRTGTYA